MTAAALRAHAQDVPFCLLYMVEGACAQLIASCGWDGEPPRSLRVLHLGRPGAQAGVAVLRDPGTDAIVAALVLGVNPRIPLDGGYRSFLRLLAGHVEDAIGQASRFSTSGSGPRRSPSWTGRRASSSATSATSCAPR